MLLADRFHSGDAEAFARLWHAYEGHRNRPDDREAVTRANWAALMAGDGRLKAFALRDADSGEVVGFALYVFHFCTKSPRDECYLNDLFVAETHRGRGGGRALLDALVRECEEREIIRLTWVTEKDNRIARKLYDHYCAGREWVRYKMMIGSER